MKKLYLIVLITAFITAIGAVNDAYMEMTGKQDSLMPEVSRINEEQVRLKVFGQEKYIHTAMIAAQLNKMRYKTSLWAKGVVKKMEAALGIEHEDPARQAYGVEVL